MSAHVLLNLLHELGKRDKMRGLPSILSLFRNEFNKFNNTRARMLGPIHMHKIYTCKYFDLWSKFTHVSKSMFNLRSHANSVHISNLKGTHTCYGQASL